MDQLLDAYKKSSDQWQQFFSVTLNSLYEIDSSIEQVQNKKQEIEQTMYNINTLSQHAQAEACIKICPRAYIPAIIKHTGEYNVEVNSEYQCTLTKDQTIEYLKEQLSEQSGILENYRIQKEQLTKRLGFNETEVDDIPDTENMPDKIITEKGIAFKQGNFYEIMEIEADVPYEKNKRRISKISRLQHKNN